MKWIELGFWGILLISIIIAVLWIAFVLFIIYAIVHLALKFW